MAVAAAATVGLLLISAIGFFDESVEFAGGSTKRVKARRRIVEKLSRGAKFCQLATFEEHNSVIIDDRSKAMCNAND